MRHAWEKYGHTHETNNSTDTDEAYWIKHRETLA
jgi:hypothetical protein